MNWTPEKGDQVRAAFNAKFGITANNLGPILDFEKFERADQTTQRRFIRLWKRGIEQCKSLDRAQLLEMLAPWSGSIEVFRDRCLREMEDWLYVWEELARIPRFERTGRKPG